MNVNSMKRIFITILLVFSVSISLAQDKETMIFYYDSDWKKISQKSNAMYSRIITFYEDDLHHPVGVVKDFYLKSGSIQWEGKFSYYDNWPKV